MVTTQTRVAQTDVAVEDTDIGLRGDGLIFKVLLLDRPENGRSGPPVKRDLLDVVLNPVQAHWLKHQLLDLLGCTELIHKESTGTHLVRSEVTIDMRGWDDRPQELEVADWARSGDSKIVRGLVWSLPRPDHTRFQIGLTHMAARYLLQCLAEPSDEFF